MGWASEWLELWGKLNIGKIDYLESTMCSWHMGNSLIVTVDQRKCDLKKKVLEIIAKIVGGLYVKLNIFQYLFSGTHCL